MGQNQAFLCQLARRKLRVVRRQPMRLRFGRSDSWFVPFLAQSRAGRISGFPSEAFPLFFSESVKAR